MSSNLILLILLLLIVLTFFSCMIAGDVFVSKIAFNSSAMNCDSFDNVSTQAPTQAPTLAPTLAPTTALSNAALSMASVVPPATTSTTAPATEPILITNSTCVGMDDTQIGFVKFRMAIYWIIFVLLTVLFGYGVAVMINKGIMGIVLLFILVVLWIFLLVGGIFLSQFAYQSTKKTCNGSVAYCYSMNNAEIVFARMASIFSFLETFAITGIILYGLYKMN